MIYTLTYNGIALNVTKTSFQQEFIYDPTNVDKLYNKVTVTVTGLIHTTYTSYPNATYVRLLRTQFAEPRQALVYTCDGYTILNVPAGGDARNGPIPDVQVFDINGESIIVTAKFETWLCECDLEGSEPGVVLSNRWTQRQDFDENGYCTITTDGLLICRTDDPDDYPDLFREVIVPVANLPAGCNRVSQSYTQSPDNVQLQWQVVDRQFYRPAVAGITTWKSRWKESCDVNNGAGAITYGTLTVTAAAPKNVDKQDILDFMFQVALSRLDLAGKDVLQSYELDEGLDTNDVTLQMTVIVTDNRNGTNNMPVSTRIGQPVYPLDSSTDITVIPPRGTFLAALFYNDVVGTCEDKTTATEPDDGDNYEPYVSPPQIGVTNAPITSDYSDYLSDEQINYPYLKYKIESHIDENQNTVQLPIAANSVGSDSATSCFCQLAQPTTTKIVNFHAERLNAQPDLPDTYIDDNHYLLKSRLTLMDQEFLPSGVDVIYVIAGTYWFGLYDTANIGTGILNLPRTPLDARPLDDPSRIMGSGNFNNELIA